MINHPNRSKTVSGTTRTVEEWREIIAAKGVVSDSEIGRRILGDLTAYRHGRWEDDDAVQLGNALRAFHLELTGK